MEGNPVNLVDPTGMISEEKADEADEFVEKLRKYNIHIEKDWGYRLISVPPSPLPPFLMTGFLYSVGCEWEEGDWETLRELRLVKQAVTRIANKMGDAKFRSAMGHVRVIRWPGRSIGDYEVRGFTLPGVISLPDFMFRSDDNRTRYDIIHEFGHIWDYRSGLTLSSEMSTFIGTRVCQSSYCRFDIDAGKEDAPGYIKDLYAGRNQLEDWAEAFANTIYPSFYRSLVGYREIGPLRKQFVEDKINGIR